MIRTIEGKQYQWLMSYIEKSEAVDKARQHRNTKKQAAARITRSKKGFYEVWAS